MSMELALIGGLAATTFAIKAAGPVALGGRSLPPALRSVVALMAPALMAALVVTSAFADGRRLALGSETAGVAAAALALACRRSILVAVALAAVVTALLRAVA